MKKSERINDLLIYLNDKKTFNLKSIMERYSISKSTALRDIQSLEEIGMPLYSKPGRNGYYGILPNRLLSPIVFTVDEVSALYFSMQTLSAYQSTPFHLSVEKLKQKFEACISDERITTMRKMELIFNLGSYQSKNNCPLLKDILQAGISEMVCDIHYLKGEKNAKYIVQFFDITSAYGQWYATAYNYQTEKPQVFRCDKIKSIVQNNRQKAKSISEFLELSNDIYREEEAVEFEVEITAKGADVFYKEHYPSMELLHYGTDRYTIQGFYNKGEENFIANYFLMYGDTIASIRPHCLKTLMLNRLDKIRKRIGTLK